MAVLGEFVDVQTGTLMGVAITQVVTCLTIIVKERLAATREDMRRKWAVEDRDVIDRIDKSVTETKATVATKLDEHAAITQASRQEIVDLLHQTAVDIHANTQISQDAFHEANGTKALLEEEVQRRNEIHAAATQAFDRRVADPVVAKLQERLDRLESFIREWSAIARLAELPQPPDHP